MWSVCLMLTFLFYFSFRFFFSCGSGPAVIYKCKLSPIVNWGKMVFNKKSVGFCVKSCVGASATVATTNLYYTICALQIEMATVLLWREKVAVAKKPCSSNEDRFKFFFINKAFVGCICVCERQCVSIRIWTKPATSM